MVLSQAGGVREYGIAEAEIPLPLLWRRPIFAVFEMDGMDARANGFWWRLKFVVVDVPRNHRGRRDVPPLALLRIYT